VRARTVVRADAVFEAALGVLLAGGAAAGWLGAGDFPHPVGAAVIATAGALLLLLGVVLWQGRIGLSALATGNATTAIAATVWLALASGFSATGGAVIAATVIGLVGLAAVQVATLRA
jgi:hypothetical protein